MGVSAHKDNHIMILLISRANSFLFIDSGQVFLTPFDQISPQSLSSLSLLSITQGGRNWGPRVSLGAPIFLAFIE